MWFSWLSLDRSQTSAARRLVSVPNYYYLQQSHRIRGGLGYDTPTIYRARTEWWSENETLANELWDNLDTSPMALALSDDYAKTHNLPLASRFPWDDEKGTYFVKAFHQLHCLVSLLLSSDRKRLTDGVHRS